MVVSRSDRSQFRRALILSLVLSQISIDAAPETLWGHLVDFESHSEWMSDAVSVEYVDEQRSGPGTRLRVPTRIGPFLTTDLMTVTRWEENRVLEAHHEGAVTGIGRFEIIPSGEGSTLIWGEELNFPWWLGGPIGHAVAKPIFRRVWRKNLQRLKERVEASR